jgi:hypothetical protein
MKTSDKKYIKDRHTIYTNIGKKKSLSSLKKICLSMNFVEYPKIKKEIIEIIDIKRIMLDTSIVKTLKKINNNINLDDYIIIKGDTLLPLSRMDSIMKVENIQEFCDNCPGCFKDENPVCEKVIAFSSFEDFLYKIPINLKYDYKNNTYEIVNGRHRVVRSILENRSTIPSIIEY